jgi:hypothetical protein
MNKLKTLLPLRTCRGGFQGQALPARLMLCLAAGFASIAVGAEESAVLGQTSTTSVGEGATTAPSGAPATPKPTQTEAQYLTLSQLADQYGIQITLISVTAAGGLVDLRLKVLDPEKARKLVGEPPTMPALVPLDSDLKLVTSHMMMHAILLKKDAVSYALYPNARGAVKPGGRVSVAFNDVRLEPIIAK